jgi:TM2 domain-containing membrane protein YozV
LVIELVGTFFGFMGLGWLYAGHTNRGIIALLVWLVVVAIAAVVSVLTGGLFACVWGPVQVIAAVVSGLQVKQAVEKENWGALR